MLGRDESDPLFLQVKEADASVLSRFVGASKYTNMGQRVVAGQRLMQASSDIFLGWEWTEVGLDGHLVELRAATRRYLDELAPELDALNGLIARPDAVNGALSLDDVRVLPLLRSAAVVKALRFPGRVRDYFETMMSRLGYQPLPAI